MESSEALVKIWFGFLKMAIKCDLPLKSGFYDNWGTKEEIATVSFNKWWRTTGKALFASSVPEVTLESSTDDYLIVKVPTCLNANKIREQVGRLALKHRGYSRRLKRKPKLTFTGDVEYKRLKQYERYLEIEFDPAYEGKTIEDKTEGLRAAYIRIKNRIDKQRATLLAAGKSAHFISARDVEEFSLKRNQRGGLTKAFISKGIEAKKVGRWRLSGQHLLLNVAAGEFPGRGYYGAQLGTRLRQRLEDKGIAEISMVAKNKGGGRKKEDLTLFKARRTKAEREAQSLKLYGHLAPNPFRRKGNVDES